MKILLAPNSFKHSLSAIQAAEAMAFAASKISSRNISTVMAPVTDGGDGLLEVFHFFFGGNRQKVWVHGPDFEKREAKYLYLPESKLAVIEMAQASGLALLAKEKQNPLETSSLGTGELLMDALSQGAERIFIGLGGSATCDGGMGVAAALGYTFWDRKQNPLKPVGKSLGQVDEIRPPLEGNPLDGVDIEIFCDVENPLLGTFGAAKVFAPQKGASPQDVEFLEQGMTHFAQKLSIFRRNSGSSLDKVLPENLILNLKGGGAAGGLGAGLVAFCQAELKSGCESYLDWIQFDQKLEGVDLVLTAEGKVDEQTAYGKAPVCVAKRAKAKNIPCFLLAGEIVPPFESLYQQGIQSILSICSGPTSLELACENAHALLSQTTEQLLRAFMAGKPEV